jgi:hypothetical protein
MKLKALRKKDTKEFADIQFDSETNEILVYTCNHPFPLAETATTELFKQYYNEYVILKHPTAKIDLDNFEVIEYDFFEAGEIGADIRNKLTPCTNLVSLLEVFFTESSEPITDDQQHKRDNLIEFIKKEMDQAKKSHEYLANLL